MTKVRINLKKEQFLKDIKQSEERQNKENISFDFSSKDENENNERKGSINDDFEADFANPGKRESDLDGFINFREGNQKNGDEIPVEVQMIDKKVSGKDEENNDEEDEENQLNQAVFLDENEEGKISMTKRKCKSKSEHSKY